MSVRKNLLIPLLAGSLAATAIWITNREVAAAPEPRAINRSMSIAPGAFASVNLNHEFVNSGFRSFSLTPGTTAMAAPLFFEAPEVKIRKIVLYAYDNGGQSVCLTMYRDVPKDGNEDMMTGVCSSGAAPGNRKFIEKNVPKKWVKEAHGPYLWLVLPGTLTEGYAFYGATVFYTIP